MTGQPASSLLSGRCTTGASRQEAGTSTWQTAFLQGTRHDSILQPSGLAPVAHYWCKLAAPALNSKNPGRQGRALWVRDCFSLHEDCGMNPPGSYIQAHEEQEGDGEASMDLLRTNCAWLTRRLLMMTGSVAEGRSMNTDFFSWPWGGLLLALS